ncbi:uncharacterized protein LOC142907746 [Petromyzon marinus]|uniref:uncharacterized protein LOC142907746 n=1 Tax=Petromyzon marinus TaxID=7757 RepID=UPI003F724E14
MKRSVLVSSRAAPAEMSLVPELSRADKDGSYTLNVKVFRQGFGNFHSTFENLLARNNIVLRRVGGGGGGDGGEGGGGGGVGGGAGGGLADSEDVEGHLVYIYPSARTLMELENASIRYGDVLAFIVFNRCWRHSQGRSTWTHLQVPVFRLCHNECGLKSCPGNMASFQALAGLLRQKARHSPVNAQRLGDSASVDKKHFEEVIQKLRDAERKNAVLTEQLSDAKRQIEELTRSQQQSQRQIEELTRSQQQSQALVCKSNVLGEGPHARDSEESTPRRSQRKERMGTYWILEQNRRQNCGGEALRDTVESTEPDSRSGESEQISPLDEGVKPSVTPSPQSETAGAENRSTLFHWMRRSHHRIRAAVFKHRQGK